MFIWIFRDFSSDDDIAMMFLQSNSSELLQPTISTTSDHSRGPKLRHSPTGYDSVPFVRIGVERALPQNIRIEDDLVILLRQPILIKSPGKTIPYSEGKT